MLNKPNSSKGKKWGKFSGTLKRLPNLLTKVPKKEEKWQKKNGLKGGGVNDFPKSKISHIAERGGGGPSESMNFFWVCIK